MPVVEICTWEISEAYANDPSVLTPALDFLSKVDGCIGVYYGLAEEDPKAFHLLLVWETLEHHKALMGHPEYPQVIGLGPSIGQGGLKMYHVEFNKGSTQAFTAPTTEILRLDLKEGVPEEQLQKVIEGVTTKIDLVKGKYLPASWGRTLEDPTKFYLTIGWDSSQAHVDTVSDPSFLPFVTEMPKVANTVLFHMTLSQYPA